MTCKYKVKIKDIQYNYKVQMTDIQSKYKFKVFCTGYDDSEIKEKIDTMYEAWPKASGEGETFTLDNTIQAPMQIDLKGNTSQEGTPTPDNPQDIHVVSGDNDIKVGQNIWNYNGTNYEQGFYNSIGGFISRSDYRCFTYDCKQGDLFERTGAGFAGIVTFWNNSTFISSQNFDLVTPKGIVQVPQNANKIKIAGTNTSSSSWIRKNPINYQVNLGEYELCKIGDYQDSIVKDNGKWYLNKQIGKVVLDGSETGWGDRPNYTYADRFVKDSVFPTNNRNMYCNYFRVNQSTDDTYPYLTNNGTQCAINFSAKGTTTLEQFKTWLSTHNTTVYYVLATPTTTEITDTTLLSQLEALKKAESYLGQTNISQVNNDATFIITAKALKDLSNL